MNLRIISVLTIVTGMFYTIPSHSQLVINELMQSNIDCIMDDMNEFPDSWVELYNVGDTTVSLGSYKIGVTDDVEIAWKLPDIVVDADAHVLVYCDKEASGWHTDFRLESGKGGLLFLFVGDSIADMVSEIPKQPAPNIALGRKDDGADEWGYQYSATPGFPNCGQLCENILGDPIFSEKGKATTSKDTITLELSLPEDAPIGTVIKVTFDGSEPTLSSMDYSTPIDITTTQTVRAKLFCQGYLSPRAVTHSYLFFDREITLPVVSIVTDSTYFFDNHIGIYVDGDYDADKKNYNFKWRRPVNFEFFPQPENESQINQLCETRVQGGATKSCKLKSLAIYAHKRFGKKRLKYEFFPDQKPGVDDFKSIIIRNAGNDFNYLFMRDAIIQRAMAKHTDLDWQAWCPTIVFINGVYKGMLNIRERSNADNIYSNYDGLEDIDMVENWWNAKEGDMKNWNAFKKFWSEQGHTLEEYAQWMDWEEFINLMLMNLYQNNRDFPGNNFVTWRPRKEGGRWRFVAKDVDFGLGLNSSKPDFNTLAWLYDKNYDSYFNWANKSEHTLLFRNLMEDDDFKREFIDRAAIYMGDFMNESGIREVWDPMYEQIQTEYPYHWKLNIPSWYKYGNELNKARDWLANRTHYFYNFLSDFYELGEAIPVSINTNAEPEDLKDIEVSINNVKLSKGLFDGKFFYGRTMDIIATSINEKKVIGWNTFIVIDSTTTKKDVTSGDKISLTLPSCEKVIIEAQFDNEDGIFSLMQDDIKWTFENDVLTLRQVDQNTPVDIYDLAGRLVFKGQGYGHNMTIPIPLKGFHIVRVGNHILKVR